MAYLYSANTLFNRANKVHNLLLVLFSPLTIGIYLHTMIGYINRAVKNAAIPARPGECALMAILTRDWCGYDFCEIRLTSLGLQGRCSERWTHGTTRPMGPPRGVPQMTEVEKKVFCPDPVFGIPTSQLTLA